MKTVRKNVSCYVSLTKEDFRDSQFWSELLEELEVPIDMEEIDCEIVGVDARKYKNDANDN